jgi:hypothetical protein
MQGSLVGPPEALEARFDVDTGQGTVRVRSLANLVERSAEGRVLVDGLAADFLPSASTMVMWAEASFSLRARRLAVTVDGRYRHRQPAHDLHGLPGAPERHATWTPGGRLHAALSAQVGERIDANFEGRLSDSGGAARLVDGKRGGDLVVRGHFVKPAHRRASMKLRTTTAP